MRDLTHYDSLRPSIKTGDLVEFASTGIIGRIIMGVTGRGASHSSLVVRLPYKDNLRRYVIEAVGTGLEFKLLSDVLQNYAGSVIWYGLRKEYDDRRDAIGDWAFCELAQHKKYDFGGLFAQLWGRVSLDARKYFCSEFIDAAYIAEKIIPPDPAGARRPGDFAPLGIFGAQSYLLGEQS